MPTEAEIASAKVESVRSRIEIVSDELRQMGPAGLNGLRKLAAELHLAGCRVQEAIAKRK